MPVAALYDIHGNSPALEAVLDDVQQAGADAIVVGGDVVPGPMQQEALALLTQLGTRVSFIHGNGEVAVLGLRGGLDPATLPAQAREPVQWSAQHLTPDEERLLASWPKTLRMEIRGVGSVLFCHGTPRDENEIFTRLTPEERLAPAFAGVDADVVVCGHTHMQFDRMVGDLRVVNAGSVGMPFGEPGAYWLLLGPDIQLRRTSYDLSGAAERITATAYPQARIFADQYVLRPPTEAVMLEAYSRVGMK
jgi:predicted phosphodiesterase